MSTTDHSDYDPYSAKTNYRLTLHIWLDDTSGNSSRWNWSLRATRVSGASSEAFDLTNHTWNVNVEGSTYSGSADLDFRGGNPPNVLATGTTGYKTHNSAGNITVNYSASHGAFSVFGTASLSGSFSGPTLAQVPDAPSAFLLSDGTTVGETGFSYTPGASNNSAIVRNEVQWANNSAFTGATLISPAPNPGSVVGLVPRGLYYYRVRSVNSIGNGAWSVILSRNSPDIPDIPVYSVGTKTATAIPGTVTAPGYVGAGGITAFQTQISLTDTFSSVITTQSGNTNNFTGLTRATRYFVRSRASNAYGWSAYTDPLAVTTLVTAPSAPTGYAVTDLTSTTCYVGGYAFADNGGLGIDSVEYALNTIASFTGSTTGGSGKNEPPLLSGLTPGTTYYVALRGHSLGAGGSFGAYGAWVSFTTLSNVPNPPTGLTASSITNTTATLSWTAPSNLYGATLLSYALRVAPVSSFGSGLQAFTPAGVSQALTGLQPGTTYYCQVWTNTNNGIGSYSTVYTFTTTGTAPTATSFWMRIAGVWKSGKLWMRVSGVWKLTTPWQRVSGTWRKL
jgi:hypothetical protein